MESVTENNRLFSDFLEKVRVKMCGKSAQAAQEILQQDKPHREQDKIGRDVAHAFSLRVCRIR